MLLLLAEVVGGACGVFLLVQGARISEGLLNDYWGTRGLFVGFLLCGIGLGYFTLALDGIWGELDNTDPLIPLPVVIGLTSTGVLVGIIYTIMLIYTPKGALRKWRSRIWRDPNSHTSFRQVPPTYKAVGVATVLGGFILLTTGSLAVSM